MSYERCLFKRIFSCAEDEVVVSDGRCDLDLLLFLFLVVKIFFFMTFFWVLRLILGKGIMYLWGSVKKKEDNEKNYKEKRKDKGYKFWVL